MYSIDLWTYHDNLDSMSISHEQRQQLIEASQEARKTSYSPYSNFRVGAAILCSNDEIIQGANVENKSPAVTSCAEKTAFVKAITSGHSNGSFLAVSIASGE